MKNLYFLAIWLVASPVLAAEPPTDKVLFEIFEGIPDKRSWDFEMPARSDRFTQSVLALAELPQHYNDRGVRADRKRPFVVRATTTVRIPAGEWRIVVRSLGGARLYLDDEQVAKVTFPPTRNDGHGKVFEYRQTDLEGTRYLQPGNREGKFTYQGDGEPHQLRLEVVVGGQNRRPETGELSVSMARPGEMLQIVAHGDEQIPLTDADWLAWKQRWRQELDQENARRRRQAAEVDADYWKLRHQMARDYVASQPAIAKPPSGSNSPNQNVIDQWIDAALKQAGVQPAPLLDDAEFLRRLSLDTRGIIPLAAEVSEFLADTHADKRSQAIERFLDDPSWADHWVGYWQDLLAENPNLVNPTLNNTGPFRWWIYESFLDNKPMDRFATELIMMGGSKYFGGPAGFAMATENDMPMAGKAHVLGRAFLGMDMSCARCHDAPHHDFAQKDLFSLAAMLKRSSVKVPKSSTIQRSPEELAKLAVKISLKPGESVHPKWPFAARLPSELPEPVLRDPKDSREQFAALVTSPRNEQFAQVLVNRLWQRYFGRGLVESLDDWQDVTPSHPKLLEFLARELMVHDYDLKHVARLILNSRAYQRGSANAGEKPELFASSARRRMTAEQLIDSLFRAAGKPFGVEAMNIDVDSSRDYNMSLNLGEVRRAWQFASLSNERDRPSLQLPFAQRIVVTLEAFGWRGERQNPLSVRDDEPRAIQPALLANGVAARRITQLSDESAFTELALRDQPLESLVEAIFLRTLGRSPDSEERTLFVKFLSLGYADRKTDAGAQADVPIPKRKYVVSWTSHLDKQATVIQQELARQAGQGDPPTPRLAADWRERLEDTLWALINTPEFLFVP